MWLRIRNSPCVTNLQTRTVWKKTCNALCQTTFNCTWRLRAAQWAIVPIHLHGFILGYFLPNSLKIQFAIHRLCTEGVREVQFVNLNVITGFPLQSRKHFHSRKRILWYTQLGFWITTGAVTCATIRSRSSVHMLNKIIYQNWPSTCRIIASKIFMYTTEWKNLPPSILRDVMALIFL